MIENYNHFIRRYNNLQKLFLVYLAEIHKKYHYEPSAIKRNRNGKQECSSQKEDHYALYIQW